MQNRFPSTESHKTSHWKRHARRLFWQVLVLILFFTSSTGLALAAAPASPLP